MNWITLLFQASLLYCLLYGLYWLLLRNDTHYQLNRLLLLGIILATISLPLLPFPSSVIELEPRSEIVTQLPPTFIQPANEMLDFETNIIETPGQSFHINWLQLLIWVYWAGVIVVGLRFLFQVFCMIFLLQSATFSRYKDYYIAQSKLDFQPFSFFNVIFISEAFFSYRRRTHYYSARDDSCSTMAFSGYYFIRTLRYCFLVSPNDQAPKAAYPIKLRICSG